MSSHPGRRQNGMTTITPFLWFDDNLQEALDFYGAIFPDAKVHGTSTGPDGKLFMAEFELAGQDLKAINAGPAFRFNEAISMFITCDGQDEVDRYWEALLADGGEESQCGWLKDRFGLSWQVVPQQFLDMMSSGDTAQVERVTACMMTQRKLVLADLEAAFKG